MSRDRDNHHNRVRNRFVTFKGYLTKEHGENEDMIEVRTHVKNLTLRNKVKKDALPTEEDWYDFEAIVEGTVYHIDEKTFRRLMSCFSASNS